MYRESHARSVIKGFTWRIIATTTTFTISYLLIRGVEGSQATSNALHTAGWIAGLEFFIKIALYYVHERAWQMAPRGSIRRLLARKSKSETEESSSAADQQE